jgi:hypothetical protein
MTYDRRTGKPIASAVTKIAPEVVSGTFVLIWRLYSYIVHKLDDCFTILLSGVE